MLTVGGALLLGFNSRTNWFPGNPFPGPIHSNVPPSPAIPFQDLDSYGFFIVVSCSTFQFFLFWEKSFGGCGPMASGFSFPQLPTLVWIRIINFTAGCALEMGVGGYVEVKAYSGVGWWVGTEGIWWAEIGIWIPIGRFLSLPVWGSDTGSLSIFGDI
ncbi:hypothetical protein Tco_1050333 [Tanacetum coccineum]